APGPAGRDPADVEHPGPHPAAGRPGRAGGPRTPGEPGPVRPGRRVDGRPAALVLRGPELGLRRPPAAGPGPAHDASWHVHGGGGRADPVTDALLVLEDG